MIGEERFESWGDQKSPLHQAFSIALGRAINEKQEAQLSREVEIDNYVFYFPYMVHDNDYQRYLSKVKTWANRHRWSTPMIIKLLLDPSRNNTGYYDNGGRKITKTEWRQIKKWEMMN